MTAFYNEIEPFAVAWLRNLSAAGHVAPGVVDDRSIKDLRADDVRGVRQAHFFAGIGVWSYALRLAGWPDDRPVWTGSCPCQPFSVAGRRCGLADERHLWPEWFRLIRECRPPVVFGEQVASPDGLAWFDAVSTDLEGAGYAVRAFDLCAAGFGAPHIRQRLYFVAVGLADRDEAGRSEFGRSRLSEDRDAPPRDDAHGRGESRSPELCGVGLADAAESRRIARGRAGEPRDGRGKAREQPGRLRPAGVAQGDASRAGGGRDSGAVPRAEGESARERRGAGRVADEPLASGDARDVAEPDEGQRGRRAEPAGRHDGRGKDSGRSEGDGGAPVGGATRGFWSDCIWIPCKDGKARPAQPCPVALASGFAGGLGPMCPDHEGCTFPLIDGAFVRERVGRLRGYGNAIVAEQAAEFIRAVMDVIDGLGGQ